MIISTSVAVKTGSISVPMPDDTPLSSGMAKLPVIGCDFSAGAAGTLELALPLEVARDFHRLLGEALDGKSDLIISKTVPSLL